ncbi:MAG: hypothetical protein WB586_13100 [Chthoniobacterales bacterium]
MKGILQGRVEDARRLATFTFIGLAVALSFLMGCCIRWLVILGVGFVVRYWIGYLALLSC